MKFPPSVHTVVEKAERDNREDCAKATDAAVKAVRRLPEFKTLVNDLIYHAIQDLVHQRRHHCSVEIRRASGGYGGPPKVVVGKSEAVERVYESVYQYRIGGTVLGELTGARVVELKANEVELAKGHEFNAALLAWVERQGVGAEERVKEKIPERKLAANFERIRKEVLGGAGRRQGRE